MDTNYLYLYMDRYNKIITNRDELQIPFLQMHSNIWL